MKETSFPMLESRSHRHCYELPIHILCPLGRRPANTHYTKASWSMCLFCEYQTDDFGNFILLRKIILDIIHSSSESSGQFSSPLWVGSSHRLHVDYFCPLPRPGRDKARPDTASLPSQLYEALLNNGGRLHSTIR